jgi:hypothetical protein
MFFFFFEAFFKKDQNLKNRQKIHKDTVDLNSRKIILQKLMQKNHLTKSNTTYDKSSINRGGLSQFENIYQVPTTNMVISDEKLNTSSILGFKTECPLIISTQHCTQKSSLKQHEKAYR